METSTHQLLVEHLEALEADAKDLIGEWYIPHTLQTPRGRFEIHASTTGGFAVISPDDQWLNGNRYVSAATAATLIESF